MLVTHQPLSDDRWRMLLPPFGFMTVALRAGDSRQCGDWEGFFFWGNYKRKLVTSCHFQGGGRRELRWGQQGAWRLCLRFLSTSQRAGCLPQINALFSSNNDSSGVNHFQKWIATFLGNENCEIPHYNGRFSVGGSITQNFSRSKWNLVFKKKESTVDTESKSISSRLVKNCHSRSLYFYIEPYVPILPAWVSSWDYGFIANSWWFPMWKVANYKKCYPQWVGDSFWRLLLN